MEGDEREVVDVYVAYLNDVNQLRTSRQTDNTTRLSVVTLLLGAQAFLINSVLTDARQSHPTFAEARWITWAPILAIALVGFVGWVCWLGLLVGFVGWVCWLGLLVAIFATTGDDFSKTLSVPLISSLRTWRIWNAIMPRYALPGHSYFSRSAPIATARSRSRTA